MVLLNEHSNGMKVYWQILYKTDWCSFLSLKSVLKSVLADAWVSGLEVASLLYGISGTAIGVQHVTLPVILLMIKTKPAGSAFIWGGLSLHALVFQHEIWAKNVVAKHIVFDMRSGMRTSTLLELSFFVYGGDCKPLCSVSALRTECCTNSWKGSMCVTGSTISSHCKSTTIVHICSLPWVLSLWKLWYHLWVWPAIPLLVHAAKIHPACFLVWAEWVWDTSDRNPTGNSL